MRWIVFWAVASSLVLSNGLLIWSIARPELRLWPLPEKGSRRYAFTRFTGALGPLSILGALALGVLDWDSFVFHHWLSVALGTCLLIPGGAFALAAFLTLGVHASRGFRDELTATGPYRYSRNPQYVGTIVGLLGYVFMTNSALTLIVWALWTAWFILAPFAEEPWLREQLGGPYEEYASRVPRFL
jgi:protein-S-isoprenylcysteine O-methyltransferase Ste14